jgi:hypothetical protein
MECPKKRNISPTDVQYIAEIQNESVVISPLYLEAYVGLHMGGGGGERDRQTACFNPKLCFHFVKPMGHPMR